MKKFITLLLGAALALGTVTMSMAQEPGRGKGDKQGQGSEKKERKSKRGRKGKGGKRNKGGEGQTPTSTPQS